MNAIKKGSKVMGALLIAVAMSFASAQEMTQTLWDALVADETFSTFASLLEQTGYAEQLQGEGEYTVLAPTNEAFENLGEELLGTLQNDPELLKAIVGAHIIEGFYRLNDLQNAESVVPLQGEPLEIGATLTGLEVNTANFVATNVENEYANGLLHVMREVVVPMSLRAQLGLDGSDVDADMGADADTGVVYAFTDVDADGDGFISEEEFAGVYGNADRFGDFDTDGDGLISEDEFEANQGLLEGDMDGDMGAEMSDMGADMEAEGFAPALYQPYGRAEVGDYELIEGYEPGVNDADFPEGALVITTVSPSGQGVDVVIIGPNGYKNVIEVGERQLVEGLMPGTYVLMATDDGLEAVSTKVDVAAGRVAPVTLTLSEIGTTAYDPAYEPYGAFEMGAYEPIDTADLGNLRIVVRAEGLEGVNIVGSIVGPDDFREDIDGVTEEINLEGLMPGVYHIAVSAEGGDLSEGLIEVRGSEAASASLMITPMGARDMNDMGESEMEGAMYAFTDFDADGDGFISEEEFGSVYSDADLFGTFDTDGDGFVNQDEFEANRGLLE